MKPEYDVAVAGLGAIGSATVLALARRGARVLGLDRYAPPHTLGSSHGAARIIREAYYEHPLYVPLVRRAWRMWEEIAAEARAELLLRTGGLMVGPPDGALIRGTLASAKAHGLAHECLDAAEVRRRFPALAPADGMVAVHEERAGVLFPERCIVAMQALTAAAGATLRTGEALLGWSAGEDGVTVRTERGTYAAGALVLAVGPWLPSFPGVPALGLEVERQVQGWFAPLDPSPFRPGRCPITMWEYDGGPLFHAFPDLGEGVKGGLHHGGVRTDPESVDRRVSAEDERRLREVVRRFMPGADGPLSRAEVCLYTNTADHHFLLDRHPEQPRVVLAGGCSGHGFKFAPVLGSIAAGLALAGANAPVGLPHFSRTQPEGFPHFSRTQPEDGDPHFPRTQPEDIPHFPRTQPEDLPHFSRTQPEGFPHFPRTQPEDGDFDLSLFRAARLR